MQEVIHEKSRLTQQPQQQKKNTLYMHKGVPKDSTNTVEVEF